MNESRPQIEIRSLVLQIQSEILVRMDMFDEGVHVFDVHLSVRIESYEPFDLEFIAVFLDEVISRLIGRAASPVDRMIQDDDELPRVLIPFISKHLERIVARAVIDQD